MCRRALINMAFAVHCHMRVSPFSSYFSPDVLANTLKGVTMGSSDPPSPSGGVSVPPNVDVSSMRFESRRLSTFASWPTDAPVAAGKIAKAGLYHTGQNNEAKCLWCQCVLNNWEYGDQVKREI